MCPLCCPAASRIQNRDQPALQRWNTRVLHALWTVLPRCPRQHHLPREARCGAFVHLITVLLHLKPLAVITAICDELQIATCTRYPSPYVVVMHWPSNEASTRLKEPHLVLCLDKPTDETTAHGFAGMREVCLNPGGLQRRRFCITLPVCHTILRL
jgi:hypothetical protein